MSAVTPGLRTPVRSVAEVIERMEFIEATTPSSDGVACFNRMYLEVTRTVGERIGQHFFADPEFMTRLDVIFANLYFDAVDAAAVDAATPAAAAAVDAATPAAAAAVDTSEPGSEPGSVPPAWQPLFLARADTRVEPIQFALAGMNAHINHDLPLAVVAACEAAGTEPSAAAHYADYEKVDRLLDAAEQAIRESFETVVEADMDRHLRAVANLVTSWTINSARDLAWNNALLLWQVRGDQAARDLLASGLAAAAAQASRLLLVAI